MRNKVIACIMVLAMFASLGFMPGGDVSAADKYLKATVPSKYRTNYNIYSAIDISAWQGGLSESQFRQIRALGITHVIIRCGYTNLARFKMNKDRHFETNITNAYKAGMKIGVYYYSQAKTNTEARKEANYTVSLIKKHKSKISLPVVFDYEFGGRLYAGYAKKKGKKFMTNIAIAYCDKVRSAGFKPMVYANYSMMNTYVNRDTLHARYPIWLAHYTKNCKATSYNKEMAMWQYSSSGRLKNATTGKTIVSGRIDMNYVFVKKGTNNAWNASTGVKSSSSGKYKVKVTKALNVRKGPAKSYKKVGTYKKGKKVTIIATKNGWGKIKKNKWISLKYTKRI